MTTLLQITNGAIAASWVLVLVCSAAGALGLIILNDMRSSIKSIVARQNEQAEKLTKNIERTEYAHERINELKLQPHKTTTS